MFPGPVFAIELLTTARRSRYYALRSLYGLVILLVIWVSYREFVDMHGEGRVLFTPNEMSIFARRTFDYFVIVQGLVVLAVTPALVGGVIASEKQRKTLHYLLASQLSSPEIIFGKLFARMLMVFVYLLAGVPLLFLMRLFGGVDAGLIIVDFGMTVCFAIFLGSLAIFFSTIMKQARTAIMATYITMFLLAISPAIAWMFSLLFLDGARWLTDTVDWLSPIVNISEVQTYMFRGGIGSSIERIVIAQTIYSCLFLAYATSRLRTIAANQTNKPRLILRLDKRGKPTWRALPRPGVGDDPMLWKERFTSRAGGWVKMLGLLNNIFWATLIGVTTFEYARTAIYEVYGIWFLSRSPGNQNRQDFLNAIRWLTVGISSMWILGTAMTAASSIASEREDDTWISLIATDLEGREILRAKMLGAILRFRWLGLMLFIVWIMGMIGGAIHPLSFLIATLELCIFLGFASALGVRASLTSTSTSRALAMTFGVLITMSGGYLLCCFPIPRFSSNTAWAGVMPKVLWYGLFSSQSLSDYEAFQQAPPAIQAQTWDQWGIVPSLVGIILYLVLGSLLTQRAFALFDVVVDRPTSSFDGNFEARPPIENLATAPASKAT